MAEKEEKVIVWDKEIITNLETGEVTEVIIGDKDNPSTFWERLGELQGEAPVIQKNGYNKHRDYYYALIDDILKVYKPLLSKYKLVLVNELDTSKNLLTTYVKDVFGAEQISTNYEVKKASDQDVGKSLTYGRRYNAGLLLNIATDDDTDAHEVEAEKNAATAWYYQPNTTPTNTPPKKPAPAKTTNTKPAAKKGITASVKQIELIKDLLPTYTEAKKAKNEVPLTLEGVLESVGKSSLEECTIKQASGIITKLKAAIW